MMCGIDGCIYVKGHGGEHFTPEDGKDHSDEIRLRILRDEVAAMRRKAAAFDDLLAALKDTLALIDRRDRGFDPTVSIGEITRQVVERGDAAIAKAEAK